MKKLILLVLTISLFLYCGPKQDEVERYMEDGVEVIVNHLEPYEIKGEPSTLHLEEEFTIDTERDEIAELGLTDIWGFDVNTEGNIYFFKSPMSKEDLVLKFDRYGNFMTSFARKGQGPSEIQYSSYHKINNQNEIVITDTGNKKLLIFSKDGELIEEIRLNLSISSMGGVVLPLESGNYLIRRLLIDPSVEYWNIILNLFNSKFEEIKELDRYKLDDPLKVSRFRFPSHVSIWDVSKGNIYVGNEEKGYEIWVYDLEGNLLRRIKKEYKPVDIPDKTKRKIMKQLEVSRAFHMRKKIYFPSCYPPFQQFFSDDKGRLFVMTYEEGENPKEYMFDIFNQDGIFIGRKSLRILLSGGIFMPGSPMDSWITMKNNRLYCLREKESGYKELVVYKMRWE